MEQEKLTQRKQQALDTRRKIFNTALNLIKEKGFDKVSVDDICAACGVSKGAFYHHFKSKLDIMSESESLINDMLENIQIHESDGSIKEKLLILMGSILDVVEKSGVEVTRQLTVVTTGGHYIQQENRNTFAIHTRKLIQQILAEAVEKGELSPETNKEASTEIIMTFLSGMIADWCIFNGAYSISEKGWWLSPMIIDALL
ncbi:TetR/AcrR family transcriptional regulator [Jingyaoa shaoxingensis]|uniref:TetR/AcrR family transcriptional regulator n=1 Tax=Jingyaoa shaoxingensis TaxID=2763671 RepID=A0ABR7N8T5_9FIRM|nr:TetR/AcrR family transcriptional regulator [Jingyaoa shaoxingensis]MBC8572806.1 TetR/AcrR family transcriptional regulator [Jingyaoa shaoxingensis]